MEIYYPSYNRWDKDMFKYDDGYIKVKPKILGI